jgi:hypothetical protein
MGLSLAHVGFGAAVWAGLLLAFIGHPEPPASSIAPSLAGAARAPAGAAAASAALSPNAPRTFRLTSVSVELPTSTVEFPTPPNAQAITANCLACHSAGMVLTQPNFSRATWAGVVDKMIHAYKAPVAEGDVGAIVDYLQATKGAK